MYLILLTDGERQDVEAEIVNYLLVQLDRKNRYRTGGEVRHVVE